MGIGFPNRRRLRRGRRPRGPHARSMMSTRTLNTRPAASRRGARVVTSAKVKVAINGFGRIGRNFLRCLEGRDSTNLEVVAVNDSGGVKQASHLLKYDSMLGTFDADVQIKDDTTISVNGKDITVVSSRDPLQLPWKEMGVDLVIEGTGVFLNSEGAGKHITAGAKKVLITAPAKGSDIPTHVVGVNEKDLDMNAQIVSNASCTTNCLAPLRQGAGGEVRNRQGPDDHDPLVHRGPEAPRCLPQGHEEGKGRRPEHRAHLHRCREGRLPRGPLAGGQAHWNRAQGSHP